MNKINSLGILVVLSSLVAGCGGPSGGGSHGTIAAAQPGYKVGKPYEIDGTWYYPQENYSYDETGIASWYGQDFHGGRTANGEIFNKNELTAAHRTLPMPSLARVTNLDNGRSIVVRINDRGPFAKGRIIDLSQRAAQLLGYEDTGTAKVRVQVLADESKAIADAMRRYGGPAPIQVASASNINQQVQAAPVAAVTSQELEPPSNTIAERPKPIASTPETRKELLTIKPLPEVVQLPVTGKNQIYVQAGAFKVYDNATRLKQRLAKLGNVNVTEAMVNGAKFYRVRVGPIADVAQADIMFQRVTKAGVDHPRIIVD